MGWKRDFRREGVKGDLKACSLNHHWEVDNEFQTDHAEHEAPSRHLGTNSPWASTGRTVIESQGRDLLESTQIRQTQ